MDVDKIYDIAKKMREAIDAVPKHKLPLPMANFPQGSCGDASFLPGAFLADSGLSGFELNSAERGRHKDSSWSSHAWPPRDGLIVDITADQFPDGPGKVIVTRDSDWHRTFETEPGESSDFREWSGLGVHHLHYIYVYKQPALLGGIGAWEATRPDGK